MMFLILNYNQKLSMVCNRMELFKEGKIIKGDGEEDENTPQRNHGEKQ